MLLDEVLAITIVRSGGLAKAGLGRVRFSGPDLKKTGKRGKV